MNVNKPVFVYSEKKLLHTITVPEKGKEKEKYVKHEVVSEPIKSIRADYW